MKEKGKGGKNSTMVKISKEARAKLKVKAAQLGITLQEYLNQLSDKK